jgi:hypothetical protein
MGKASKKKAQRRQGIGESRDDLVRRRDITRLVAAFQRMGDMQAAEQVRKEDAARAWCGGSRPAPAVVPRWAKGSAGERFFAVRGIREAAGAPSLATATLPAPDAMADDPAHWRVAADVLVRAVVFDGLTVSDAPVSAVIELLAPAAAAEFEYLTEEPPTMEFPDLSGPLFLIGGSALFDATLAVVGEDEPLAAVYAVLESRLDAVLAPLGLGADLTGARLAAALVCALTHDYRFDEPADQELLTRLNAESSAGNALEGLVREGAVTPEDAIRVGLAALAGLADLCRTDAPSILPAHAP